jgi:adenosine deaminase
VCPLSNVKLCVFPDLAHHPLNARRRIVRHGQFRRSRLFRRLHRRNFVSTFTALPFDVRDAYNLARNRFTASFVDEGSKRDWIETLDTAFAAA